MKKYLPLFLLLTISFGQDILITNGGSEFKGEVLEKGYFQILFQAEGAPNAQNVKVETIKSLTLKDGTLLVEDGRVIQTIKKTNSNSFGLIKIFSPSFIGGALVTLSGIILYANNQRTVDDDMTLDELENFTNKTKSNADLSYLCLIIGGFLIAIDNTELPDE
jgi:hypothetical protein